MIIERNIGHFTIFSDQPLFEALARLDATTLGFVLCLDSGGVLQGVLTDGDFRRWLLSGARDISLNSPVSAAMSRTFISRRLEDEPEEIEKAFSEKVKFVPLLDAQQRLVGIARNRKPQEGIRISGRLVDDHSPAFVIAEIGMNHNGSFERAVELIDAAANAGADCVKFQMRHLPSLYREASGSTDKQEDLGVEYTLSLLERFELPHAQMAELFAYARRRDMVVMCTPWDVASLRFLEEAGIPAFKIASADMTNLPLVSAAARTGAPLIVSTGMSQESEIAQTVALLKRLGCPFVLLHCNSTYPTPFKDVHLNFLPRLKELGGCTIGYSGHERGFHVVLSAVALGAKVIEKHITMDKSLEGNDHKVSLLPDEFRQMVEMIRQVESAMGISGGQREVSVGEMMNRVALAKSIIAAREITAGEVISPEMLEIKSPGRGLQPNRFDDLIGRPAKRNLRRGDFFYPSDLNEELAKARQYKFNRPWGIPVRWHDFKDLMARSNPDLLEFHLSFKDMDVDYMSFLDGQYDLDLVVHTPELFAGDHQLDLSSPDPRYRRHSIAELQRVINITRDIKPHFKRATNPVIVTNLGGFTSDAPLDRRARLERYATLARSLKELDMEGVEVVGQTMPPLPWCFGGQIYHNLLLHPEDTVAFCEENSLRLCLDVSHSKMTCSYHHIPFSDFVAATAPLTAHLHLADAVGADGEGRDIGQGDIDWPVLLRQLDQLAPRATFIPEIWMGHRNHGEGFWENLDKLEGFWRAADAVAAQEAEALARL
jgi:sialic acid synthase SpsE/sugar phosphate isomerase/epimerase